VATDWYVFAEHRLTLDTDAGPADLRTASIYAFGHDGRLVAQIGTGRSSGDRACEVTIQHSTAGYGATSASEEVS